MPYKNLIQKLGFSPKENTSGIFVKKYMGCDNYGIEIDFENEKINYGKLIKSGTQTTLNFSQAENWVVLECVNRLLDKGYKPENITLEKVYPAGHGFSGRLDVCVTRDDGSEYLLIECKTYGKEFEKAVARLNKDGGQLFTYFKFSSKADVIMLYASEINAGNIIYKNEIVKVEDDYRTGDVKDFYDKWNKLTKDNGVFDNWVNPYQFVSKALSIKLLEPIKQEDSSFIFNRFLEILRHNVVSDKPNAFNKIFTLFLCKIYDEKDNEDTDNELGFQWLEGIDDDISFQLRLTDLYKNGMYEFLEKKVTDFSEIEFERKFKSLDDSIKSALLTEFKKIRLEKNNEFAIKEVYDEKSFKENAKVVKEVVELLQGYKIRYTKKQQYLSDFFELLLTTGLKQESGQFFTPVPIAQFIIKSLPIDSIVEDKLQKGEGNNLLPFVMDYAAGSGHFLTETMHEMQRLINQKDDKNYNPSTAKKIRNWKDDHFDWALDYVYGIEKDYRLVKVGKVGCYLHGDGLANVLHTDGLASFNHPDYKGKLKHADKDFPTDNKQFDILVSNPPYSVSAFKNASREYYRENDFSLYDKLTDNSSEIECLFIERTKQLLKDGGVAGIILPSSILSNGGLYARSREIILQYFDIVAIAELGSNTFMATGTNTVTLFLRRRNNYESINLTIAVDKFFTSLKDVTLNGIEKPVTKYVQHVWEGITIEDYLTLLQEAPNEAVATHEIFIEYKKKIKAKNDKEFWLIILDREREKIYYFIIALPQKVVLIKSGNKEEEKEFLGYEFSNRRGSEGIHAIQRGKNIEDCTTLFDPELFDNPTKASTYIYKAFNGDFDFEIHQKLKKNISRHSLVDMLMFNRVDFEKTISLSVKKKVIIESQYQQEKIENIFTEIKNGKNVIQSDIVGKFRVSRIETIADASFNIQATKWTNDTVSENDFLKKGDILLSHINSVEHLGKSAFYDLEEKIVHGVNLLRFRPDLLKVVPRYVSEIFKVREFILEMQKYAIKAANQASLNSTNIKNLQVPIPPKDIQEKIVAEIEKCDKRVLHINGEVEKLNSGIKKIYITNKLKHQSVVLSDEIEIIGGGTPSTSKPEYWNGTIPWLSIVDFKGNSRFVKVTEKHITNEGLKNSSAKYLEVGDIIISARGTVGALAQLQVPMTFNQSCYGIKPKANLLSSYLYFSLKFEIEQFKSNAYGTIFDSITTKTFDLIKIPLPSINDQEEIVSQIEAIDLEISKLELEISEIPKKKQLVLKKYL